MGKAKLSTERFIELAREVHGDEFDYSKSDYKGYKDYIVVICKKHGDFNVYAANHLNGSKCLKCAHDKWATERTMKTEYFISKALIAHNNKYDYSVTKIQLKNKYVNIICPIHGIFEQGYIDHLQGYGCGKCGGTQKLTTEEFIKIANKIHKGIYVYDKVNYKTIWMKENLLIILKIVGARRIM